MSRYLVTKTVSYFDPTPWGDGIDLEDEKNYVDSRYGKGRKLLPGVTFLWYELRFALHVLRLYLQNRYEAVSVGRYGAFFPLLARMLGLRARVVMTDVEFRPQFRNRLLAHAMRRCDAICVNTMFELEALSRTCGVSRDKFQLVKLAFLPQDLSETADRNFVLTGGVQGRDWATFGAAVEGLPYEVKIFAKNFNYKLPSNSNLIFVSRKEYYRALAAASCVVLTLEPEPLRCTGTTTWTTAMAMGKVVIATGADRAWDYIEHGVSGFVVDHGDAAGLRKTIQMVMEDAELRRRVGKAARLRAWQDCSPEVYRRKVLAIMKGQPLPAGRYESNLRQSA